jgi:hypothetical protein
MAPEKIMVQMRVKNLTQTVIASSPHSLHERGDAGFSQKPRRNRAAVVRLNKIRNLAGKNYTETAHKPHRTRKETAQNRTETVPL